MFKSLNSHGQICFSMLLLALVTMGPINIHEFIHKANYVYQSTEPVDPSVVITEFLNKYNIPEFVLRSIPFSLPNVLKDGLKLAYIIAIEGIVLLKNKNALPLHQSEKIAIFGAAQHWSWNYHCGGSSFVETPSERVVTLLKGLINAGFAVDMELVERYNSTHGREIEFTENEISYYASRNNVAIIVIGRYTTEGRDMTEGGYYLTQVERKLLSIIPKFFNKTIVILNTAGPIDMSWDTENIDAIVWVGYPGEQGGNAVAAVLMGLHSPSGKLPDTWARSLYDYPSTKYFSKFTAIYWEDIYVGYRYFDTFNVEPYYPFGHGLSYTDFRLGIENVTIKGSLLTIRIRVTNMGHYRGREVIQIYISKPVERLEKPSQELIAFAKTDLLEQGESQVINIVIDLRELKSYDEKLQAWILDRGDYLVRVGFSSRRTIPVAILTLDRLVIVEQVLNRMHAPVFNKLTKNNITILNTILSEEIERVPRLYIDPLVFITSHRNASLSEVNTPIEFRPIELIHTITLKDVWEGRFMLEQLIAQMNLEELVNLTIGLRGHEKYGVPELRHADGPNGLRQGPSQNPGGIAYPSATILASSWDMDLAKIYGIQIGREMIWADIVLWLAPAINIHRNPLGGRSAEYFSEDPVLTGVMAAEVVKGVQSNHGIGAVVKHFAGYEQEFNRFSLNSMISERALREIYLRPFEIVVKTSNPWSIMTSYNSINGIPTGNDPNLIQGILRYEWGFEGFVMTDWGSSSYNYRAYIAGNDALMPYIQTSYEQVLSQVKSAIAYGELSIGYLHRSVFNILKIVMKTRAFARALGIKQEQLYTYIPPEEYYMLIFKSKVELPKPFTETTIEDKTTLTTYTTPQPLEYPAQWEESYIMLVIVISVIIFIGILIHKKHK